MTDTTARHSFLQVYHDFTPERLTQMGFQLVHRPRFTLPFVNSWPQGLPDTTVLEALGLGVYRNPLGTWLLGAVDERLHPHDRWRYIRSAKDFSWFELSHHDQNVWSVLDLSEQLQNMAETLALQNVGVTEPSEALTAAQMWSLQGYRTKLRHVMRPLLQHTNLTPVELHDLAFHYTTWTEANDAIDMPRELVWRMHGLWEAVEVAQLNRGTLPFGRWNDAAFLTEEEEAKGSPRI